MKASSLLKINYSTAKTIMKTYKDKGRIHKKLTRDKIKKVRQIHGNVETGYLSLIVNKPFMPHYFIFQPRFDFSVYRQPIENCFMAMCRRQAKMIEEFYKKMTLPMPKNFYKEERTEATHKLDLDKKLTLTYLLFP